MPRPKLLFALYAAALLPAGFTLAPMFDHDTWWHLRVGQLVAETGQVPHTEPFSRLDRETQWVAYSWLYEWALFQAFDHFGPAGVLWARAVLVALSAAAVFALFVKTWHGRELLPLVLAAITLMPLARERPWHLTIALTALTAMAVGELRAGVPARRFWWLPLVFALWANLHIQFVLGWLLLGLACVVPARADRRWLIALTLGCVLATLANPYHVRLLGVVWEYATQTGALREVQELALPDPSRPWLWAALALLAVAAVHASHKKPTDWFSVAVLVIALVLVLRMRRDVWFAAIAAGMVVRTIDLDQRSGTARVWVLGTVAATVLGVRLLNLAGVGPSTDTDAANAKQYPVRAVAYLQSNPHPGPLFNSFDWGGYLIWALREHPVSIDGRTNLYGSDRLTRTIRTWNGEPGCDANPDLTSARIVIAPQGLPLASILRTRPTDWRVAYEDDVCVVFLKPTP